MRHLLPTALLVGLLAPALAQAETARKWTHGRSSCDPVAGQLDDSGAPAAVDRQPLERAWEYAVADVESLSSLDCFPEAGKTAARFAATLQSLEGGILPGVGATRCDPAAGKTELLRLAMVRDSAGRMSGSESFFEDALDRVDQLEKQIAAAIPAEGVPFDDCRAKAQRGWARSRASLNRLSCEVSASLDRMEAFRERAEQSGLASLACAPQPAAPAVAQRAPASADAGAVLLAAPSGNGGYQAFPGADSAQPADISR